MKTTKRLPKEITYYRHIVKVEQPIKHDGPVPAYRKSAPPVYLQLNTYRLYGLDFLKHPWRSTHDYSRIRALARDASLRWPDNAAEIIVESPTVGFLPIIKYRNGIELRWRGPYG